jgi:hypothetical protein
MYVNLHVQRKNPLTLLGFFFGIGNAVSLDCHLLSA